MHFISSLVALSLPIITLGVSHSGPRRRHTPASARNISQQAGVERRADNHGQFSYYDAVGTGACETSLDPNGFTVALNADQFEGGKHCFKTVSMTWNGNHAEATIVDECESGCGFGGLDLTKTLFINLMGSLDAGVVQGQWDFGSGGNDDSQPSPSPSPKTTPHNTSTPPPPKPISTSKAHTATRSTTSSAEATSTTTSSLTSTASSKSNTSSASSSTSPASSAAAPIFSDPAAINVGLGFAQGGLGMLDLALIQFGVLVESTNRT
ncbi:hypothetical protein OF83DRAFT_1137542 [Amylostereum chailletii]|nr:hypothetical protein OF83DRAFT_1137542 [Amylostereum chailletii]